MKTKWNRLSAITAVMLLLFSTLAYTGCVKDDDDDIEKPAKEITMDSNAFSPASITIDRNTRVTWNNNDDMAHTVTSNNGKFDSGNMKPGDSYTFKFTETGTYNYFCEYHDGMTGTIEVK